MAFTGIEA